MASGLMRSLIRSGSLVLAFVCVLEAAAFAESLEGRVVQASPQALDVTVYDAQGRPYANNLRLVVDRNTQLRGIRSVTDLRPQDAVGVDTHQMESREWHADSVTLFQEVNAQPATRRKPSSSLGGALGNPVVKGALLGAATGAIASSASGGKTGKGALIGAGVGALLGGVFSQSDSQDQ